MKELPVGLQASLASGVTTLCTCWRITRGDGQVFGFTDHDRPLAFGGTVFEPSSGFSAAEIGSSLGLSVDTTEVAGALSSTRIAEEDLVLGLWDNADIRVWRVDWSNVENRVRVRTGSLGEITRGDLAFMAEIRGLAHRLNQERGRTYQRVCDAVLGDARCQVDLDDSAYAGSGVVAGSSDGILLRVTGINSFADGWFAGGVLTWTSGANSGSRIEVAAHADGPGGGRWLQLKQAAARPIADNDTFDIVAGCDKQWTTCRAKFSNGNNFRGFPHMPGNDFALSVAKRAGPNDGGSFFNGS